MSSIKELLNSLQDKPRINLNEQFMGDRGAFELAQFLQTHKTLRALELKGNNIGPDGLIKIFDALHANTVLKILNLQWNRIGTAKAGLEALAGLLATNQSIQYVNLNNNSISIEQGDILSNIIRSNKILLYLDLRWNQLGSKAGAQLLNAVQQNDTLIYLDLQGNNIGQEQQNEIKRHIDENRRKNPIPKDKITNLENPSGEPSRNNPNDSGNNNNNNPRNNNPVPPSDAQNMLNHLENVLEQEKLHTYQIKQRLELELEDLQRKDRNELRTLQELEGRCADLLNANQMMRFDIERMRDEFQLIEKNNREQIQQQEERLRNNDLLLTELERKHKNNTDRVIAEHGQRVKEQTRDWENRTRSLDQRMRILDRQNEDLEIELRRVHQKAVDMKIRQDEELRELAHRVEEQEFSKHATPLNSLEARVQSVEEARDMFLRRNHDLINQLESKQKRNSDQRYMMEDELEKLKEDHEDIQAKNNDYKVQCDRLVNDLQLQDTIIEKLEKEINTINGQIDVQRQMGLDQLNQMLRDQNEEKQTWDSQRENQLNHVAQLQRALRQSHGENARLRQEYQRLAEVVQNNVTKSIFDTFSQNNYY